MTTIKQRNGEWWVEGDDGMRKATDLEIEQHERIDVLEKAVTDGVAKGQIAAFHKGYNAGWRTGRNYEATLLARALGSVRRLLWRLADGGLKSLDVKQRRALRDALESIGLERSN